MDPESGERKTGMKKTNLIPRHVISVLTQKALENFPHRLLSQIKTAYDGLWLLFHCRTHVLKSSDLGFSAQDYVSFIYDKHLHAVETLKRNLDKESIAVVDRYIAKWEIIHKKSVLEYDFIHSDLKHQSERLKKELLYNKRTYPTVPIVPEVFYYHAGLTFLPKRVLKRIRHADILDCGAYVGDSPLVFEKKYAFNLIYAFEPNGKNYEKLLETIRRYGLVHVIPVQKAVGATNMKGISIDSGSGSSIQVQKKSAHDEEIVDICSIDSFCRETKGTVGVIKMDIEGFEMEALRGAVKTIRAYKPVLLISMYHSGRDFFKIKPFIESLKLGYMFKIRALNPYKSLYEIMLIAY